MPTTKVQVSRVQGRISILVNGNLFVDLQLKIALQHDDGNTSKTVFRQHKAWRIEWRHAQPKLFFDVVLALHDPWLGRQPEGELSRSLWPAPTLLELPCHLLHSLGTNNELASAHLLGGHGREWRSEHRE